MAKTKTSIKGKQEKKIVPVKPYTKKDGTKVQGHRRSTPNQNTVFNEICHDRHKKLCYEEIGGINGKFEVTMGNGGALSLIGRDVYEKRGSITVTQPV